MFFLDKMYHVHSMHKAPNPRSIDILAQDHTALDDLGCCCTPGAEGCDSQIDVGAQVVVFGQSKSSGSAIASDVGPPAFAEFDCATHDTCFVTFVGKQGRTKKG